MRERWEDLPQIPDPSRTGRIGSAEFPGYEPQDLRSRADLEAQIDDAGRDRLSTSELERGTGGQLLRHRVGDVRHGCTPPALPWDDRGALAPGSIWQCGCGEVFELTGYRVATGAQWRQWGAAERRIRRSLLVDLRDARAERT